MTETTAAAKDWRMEALHAFKKVFSEHYVSHGNFANGPALGAALDVAERALSTVPTPPSPRMPSEEEIRLTIGGIIVGLDLTNAERARVAAGEATAAVLALFTPH